MNWDVIKGKWNQYSGSAKAKWGELTDDDVDQVAGNQQKLSGKLQERYGWSKDKAEREVDDWRNSL
jgi:uncharacterized protein YjbJ (UPF0337 family)